ncbi:MAG: CAP domain-containing protein [Chloroflexota bacterium]|nr:CAP domain-containing protein [Chloroflexota bacterium]
MTLFRGTLRRLARRRMGIRLAAMGLAGALAASIVGVEGAGAVTFAPMSAPEYQFLAMLNADRQANGLPAVAADGSLSGLARARSQQMLASGVFGHYDAGGQLIFVQLLNGIGFPYLSAGENLAENNYDLAASLGVANTGLMNSPGHRANILNPNYNEVGIGIAGRGPTGQFYYTELFAQVP